MESTYMNSDIRQSSLIVGSNIRRFRKERGMTIEQLAKCISRSKSAVSKYENGMPIEVETLIQIARTLDISIHLLFNGVVTELSEMEKQQSTPSTTYFDCDRLYMYYFDGAARRVKYSMLEKQISHPDSGELPAKMYFNIKNPEKFWICEYSYTCVWHETAGSAFLFSRNCSNPDDISLYVFTIPLSNTTMLCGLSAGLGDNPHAPACIKVVLSKTYVEDYEKLKPACKFSKSDISSLKLLNKINVKYEFIDELLFS